MNIYNLYYHSYYIHELYMDIIWVRFSVLSKSKSMYTVSSLKSTTGFDIAYHYYIFLIKSVMLRNIRI